MMYSMGMDLSNSAVYSHIIALANQVAVSGTLLWKSNC